MSVLQGHPGRRQEPPDGPHQLRRLERLADIRVGTAVHAELLILVLRPRGKHEAENALKAASQLIRVIQGMIQKENRQIQDASPTLSTLKGSIIVVIQDLRLALEINLEYTPKLDN